MKIVNLLLGVFFILINISCKMAETKSENRQIFIFMPDSMNVDSIKIVEGSKKLLILNAKEIWKVDLNAVRGGYFELFGSKFNEIDGDKEDRIYFYNQTTLLKSYSYLEICKLDFEMVDTMKIYLLN